MFTLGLSPEIHISDQTLLYSLARTGHRQGRVYLVEVVQGITGLIVLEVALQVQGTGRA